MCPQVGTACAGKIRAVCSQISTACAGKIRAFASCSFCQQQFHFLRLDFTFFIFSCLDFFPNFVLVLLVSIFRFRAC